jgi:antitoxin VapB
VTEKAQILLIGEDQAVVLPKKYRFEATELFIRRDETTGDVVLSTRPNSWVGFFALYGTSAVPDDFMIETDRAEAIHSRDPFDDKQP